MNRVITMTDPLARTTVYTFDLAGNKTALTDPMGRTTHYGYDNANELTSIAYSDGTTPHVAYTYTGTGQRRSMADGTGTTTYQYDALDRPITVTTGAGQSVGYGYDAVGNVIALTYPVTWFASLPGSLADNLHPGAAVSLDRRALLGSE